MIERPTSSTSLQAEPAAGCAVARSLAMSLAMMMTGPPGRWRVG
jgi:hypothetical protein